MSDSRKEVKESIPLVPTATEHPKSDILYVPKRRERLHSEILLSVCKDNVWEVEIYTGCSPFYICCFMCNGPYYTIIKVREYYWRSWVEFHADGHSPDAALEKASKKALASLVDKIIIAQEVSSGNV